MLSHPSPVLKDMGQATFYPYALREVSDPTEVTLGHSRYLVTDVPPSQTPHLKLSDPVPSVLKA